MEYQRLAQLLSSLVGTAEGALTAELRGPEASQVEPPEVTGRRAAVLSSILRIVEVAKAATAARTIAGLRMALDELTAIVDVIHKEGIRDQHAVLLMCTALPQCHTTMAEAVTTAASSKRDPLAAAYRRLYRSARAACRTLRR